MRVSKKKIDELENDIPLYILDEIENEKELEQLEYEIVRICEAYPPVNRKEKANGKCYQKIVRLG